MFAPFVLLISLIAATPVIIFVDVALVDGLVIAVVAMAVALVGLTMRPGEFSYLLTILRLTAIFAAVPAICIVLQLLPVKFIGLSHPIWDSAAEALGHPVRGSISVDTGTTLLALCRYVSVVAIIFLATAVAIDRQQAGWLLTALTIATTIIAVIVIGHELGAFTSLNKNLGTDARDSIALGTVLSTATAIRTFERHETRRRRAEISTAGFTFFLLASLFSFATCWIAISFNATGPLIFAIICGLATLIIVVSIRRLGLGSWGCSAIIATAMVAVISIVVVHLPTRTTDLTLAFVTHGPLVSITGHILADGTWIGTGAGTFAALLPIYRGVDDLAAGSAAPSTAAAIAVEMGRPFLWTAVAVATAAAMFLLRGSLRRGRDSFYPAAGASCIVVLAVLSFINAGLFGATTAIIAPAILGLALAQSKGRAVQ